jgi:hypothetical protein
MIRKINGLARGADLLRGLLFLKKAWFGAVDVQHPERVSIKGL